MAAPDRASTGISLLRSLDPRASLTMGGGLGTIRRVANLLCQHVDTVETSRQVHWVNDDEDIGLRPERFAEGRLDGSHDTGRPTQAHRCCGLALWQRRLQCLIEADELLRVS